MSESPSPLELRTSGPFGTIKIKVFSPHLMYLHLAGMILHVWSKTRK